MTIKIGYSKKQLINVRSRARNRAEGEEMFSTRIFRGFYFFFSGGTSME